MIIALDFDDTLHDTKNVPPGKKLGPPTAGALEAVKQLQAAGHKIVIFCYWAGPAENKLVIIRWLDYFNFPMNMEVTNIKPDASFFVDDRALTFRGNWQEILEKII